MVGLDASILMHPTVWKASGHVDHFTDPMVDCRECRHRFRADQIDEIPWIHYCPATKGNKFTIPAGEACSHCQVRRSLCPDCGKGELTPPRQFNLMFKTFMGPVEEDASVTYLRPETAQGIFVNFDNVLQSMRRKLPFGIGQIGKAFRNEITPGNFIFRTREFEQMEIEYFVNPHETVDGRPADEYWHDRWIADCLAWFQRYGLQRGQPAPARARRGTSWRTTPSAPRTSQYRFPIGWSELMGIANRTDFDLKQHAKFSGKSLTYFDEERKEHLVPYVIEPSAGVDRALLAFLADAYREEEVRGEKRVVLRLAPRAGPGVGGGPAAAQEARRHRAQGARDPGRSVAAAHRGLRRHRRDRAALPPAGRGGHALLRDGGRADGRRHRQGRAGRRQGDDPRS